MRLASIKQPYLLQLLIGNAVTVLVESIKHLMHSQEQAAPFAVPGQALRVPLLAVTTVLPENFKINLVLHLSHASFVLPATNM